jgi:hypothetical protein
MVFKRPRNKILNLTRYNSGYEIIGEYRERYKHLDYNLKLKYSYKTIVFRVYGEDIQKVNEIFFREIVKLEQQYLQKEFDLWWIKDIKVDPKTQKIVITDKQKKEIDKWEKKMQKIYNKYIKEEQLSVQLH